MQALSELADLTINSLAFNLVPILLITLGFIAERLMNRDVGPAAAWFMADASAVSSLSVTLLARLYLVAHTLKYNDGRRLSDLQKTAAQLALETNFLSWHSSVQFTIGGLAVCSQSWVSAGVPNGHAW